MDSIRLTSRSHRNNRSELGRRKNSPAIGEALDALARNSVVDHWSIDYLGNINRSLADLDDFIWPENAGAFRWCLELQAFSGLRER